MKSLGDAALCLVAAVLWSWPYAARLTNRLADAYDAETQTWVIGWVRHALTTAPGQLWQANIFAPAKDALAFSEPLVGYAVVGLPFGLVGLGDVGVVNLVCLLFLAFTPWSIALLARELGVPRPAALLGAFAASFSALAAGTLGYVYFAASGGIAIILVAWIRLRNSATWKSAGALGLAVAALGWFSLQLFAFGLVVLGVAAVVDLVRDKGNWVSPLVKLVAALAFAGVLLVPLAIPFLRVRSAEGFRRDEAETRLHDATPRDWLTTSARNPGQDFLRRKESSEHALYPGTMTLALSAAGLFFTLLRKSSRAPGAPRATGAPVVFGSILVLVGFFGSFGYGGPLYPLLVRVCPPLFGGIRVAARFARVAPIGFGLLAAAGAASLLALSSSRKSRSMAFVALLLAIAFDVRQSGAAPAFHPELSPPPVEKFLAVVETGGPILHLPLWHLPGDSRYMFSSLAHFKPIVNGITSYVPARNTALAARLATRPVPPGTMHVLEDWPVGVVVVHEHALPLVITASTLDFFEENLRSGAVSPPLRFSHHGGDDWLFAVTSHAGAAPRPAAGGDVAANAAAFHEHVAAAPRFPSFDEGEFPAAIDAPADFADVRGPLRVQGWSQEVSGIGEIVELRIDRDRRVPVGFSRVPRPDVAAALPRLGNCDRAGYEATVPFLPGDEGPHELVVVFHSPSGLLRTLRRPFTWRAE